MTRTAGTGPIVLGVALGQPEDVIDVAAGLAGRLGTELVCVQVDPSFISEGFRADGSEIIAPIDPDAEVIAPQPVSEDLELQVHAIAARYSVAVRVLARVGDPSQILAAVADEVDATLIVVGTKSGRHRLAEFFNGSVAARLSHQQHRPVLVIPTNPVGFDTGLPWEEG